MRTPRSSIAAISTRSSEGPVVGRIEHAMEGGDPPVVGPVHHEVADVDHEGVRHRFHIQPLALARLDLEPSRRVLDLEGGYAAVVGVLARAELAGQWRTALVGIVDGAHPA